jgi:hypothetical protein
MGVGSVVIFFISSYNPRLSFQNSPIVLSEIMVWYGMAVVHFFFIVLTVILGGLLKFFETLDST